MRTATEPVRQSGRKFGVVDLDDSLRAAALAYAYSYGGEFAFMKEMRAAAEHGLSDRQVVAVLNCLWAETHDHRPPERTFDAQDRGRHRGRAVGLDLEGLADGCYAAPDATGELMFVRIKRPASGRWAGWILVDQILGGSTQRPRGYQRPGGVYRGTVQCVLAAVLADPLGASARYGSELGVCGVCARTLTVADSRARGIGPTCAKRLSVGLVAAAAAMAGSDDTKAGTAPTDG